MVAEEIKAMHGAIAKGGEPLDYPLRLFLPRI
jgi:hypothetical protein